MTREELSNLLRPNDERVNRNWEEAFRLYTEAHPGHRLKATCDSCRREVYKWLKS